MKIDREAFSVELFNELLPLARKCWQESSALKADSCVFAGERDLVIEPDLENYQKISDSLIIVTLRDEGKLVGYLVGFLYRSPHHKKILCGNGDSIYVEPAYRSYAVVLTERFEKESQAAGAQIIGWPTHPDGPVYRLLKARGYTVDDVVMEKRLCAQL
jgi:hypothetical protein